MDRRIEKLTPNQEVLLRAAYDGWLAVGRASGPADRAPIETAVRAMYAEIGEPAPLIFWLRSPLEGAVGSLYVKQLLRFIAEKAPSGVGQLGGQLWGQLGGQLRDQLGGQLRGQLGDQLRGQLWGQLWDQLRGQLWGQLGGQLWGQLWDQLGDQLRDQLWGQLGDQLGDQLGGQLRDQLWGQLRDQLGDQLGGQLRGQLWGQLRGQLWGQLWDQLGGQLGDQLGGQLSHCFWGHHELYWIAFYDFPERHLAVTYYAQSSHRLALWRSMCSAGWWWPMRGAVVLTDRPRYVHVDDAGRLHSESGPAILYEDGWGVWSWHGLRLARELIEEPIQLDQIKAERNTEIRRMMTERYGQEQWLKDGGAVLVSKDDWGKLWRLEQPDDEPLVMVEMVNATPEPDGSFKTYFERVPPNVRTPLEALAWQADLSADEYARMVVQT